MSAVSQVLRETRRGFVIVEPSTTEELDQVRFLMRSFVDWCRQRYVEQLAQVNAYFEADAYARELAGLPGLYARPRGRLLLAQVGGQAAGCVTFRPFDAESCEMKRMFVLPSFHGHGIGRGLAETLVQEAQLSGYRRMLLDTGSLQIEAQNLYHSLGFVDIEPYYPIPAEARNGSLFMELQLEAARLRG